MKKSRKMLALVLTLTLAFSCMAMPAMAANEATRSKMICGKCGSYENFTLTATSGLYGVTRQVAGCSKTNFMHKHTSCYINYAYVCDGCGNHVNSYSVFDHEVCNY